MHAVKRLLQEPLLQFLLVGVALFAVYSYQQRGRGAETSPQEIRLTLDDLAQLSLLFESQWQRPPTPEEFGRLVENKAQEEVLYREAIAMGLDKDDTIVKRRMAQKMQFLAEDVATAHEPTTDELRDWFAAHGDLFVQPPRIAFRHLYFASDRRGAAARDEAAAALAELAGQPQDSERAVADPFMFQDYYGDRSVDEIAREFGPGFAQAVVRLSPGAWQGPVESGYGWHLVFVDSVTPDSVPDFAEVEAEVKTAWLGARKAEAWRKAYAEMRARYTVLIPAPPDDVTAGMEESTGPQDAPVQDGGAGG